MRKPITLVWLKRDLRLEDHAPLLKAAELGLPTLIFYAWEPSLLSSPNYSNRHWNFIAESLSEIRNELVKYNLFLLQAHAGGD